MRVRVVFTGGGTAGHVNPNLALIDVLSERDCEIYYIGSQKGVEHRMISERGIPYYAVQSGKLRRYLSWENLIDPFKLLWGIAQSYCLLRKIKPNIIFSKGGFVALPVVMGAWLNKIPVIAHESDFSPGLANCLSLPFIDTLCVTFAGTKAHMKRQDKVEVTGTPIRQGLLHGSKEKGLAFCGLDATKPCLLVMGGSQGARVLNASLREALPRLLARFHVIHLCGKGNLDVALENQDGYRQFEYIEKELADLLAASSLVLSRAGANALCEILACGKPHVLVPLSRRTSRGDQIENARYFEAQGISTVVEEENLTADNLITAIDQVDKSRDAIAEKIALLHIQSATTRVADLIMESARAGTSS